jgi:hypothetical protein
MKTFKVGDRVRSTKGGDLLSSKGPKGFTGVILYPMRRGYVIQTDQTCWARNDFYYPAKWLEAI